MIWLAGPWPKTLHCPRCGHTTTARGEREALTAGREHAPMNCLQRQAQRLRKDRA